MFVHLTHEAGPGDLGLYFKTNSSIVSSIVCLEGGLMKGLLGLHHSLIFYLF
jgi:hypothetical protein